MLRNALTVLVALTSLSGGYLWGAEVSRSQVAPVVACPVCPVCPAAPKADFAVVATDVASCSSWRGVCRSVRCTVRNTGDAIGTARVLVGLEDGAGTRLVAPEEAALMPDGYRVLVHDFEEASYGRSYTPRCTLFGASP